MGYYQPNSSSIDLNYEPNTCIRRYEHLIDDSKPLRDRRKILAIPNTLDSDILPNGLCMFSSGHFYPFINFQYPPRKLLDENRNESRSSIYIMDMNYLDQLKPVALDIVDDQMQPKQTNEFNLFSMSIYQDEMDNFNILAANYHPNTRSTRIEKFSLDMNRFE